MNCALWHTSWPTCLIRTNITYKDIQTRIIKNKYSNALKYSIFKLKFWQTPAYFTMVFNLFYLHIKSVCILQDSWFKNWSICYYYKLTGSSWLGLATPAGSKVYMIQSENEKRQSFQSTIQKTHSSVIPFKLKSTAVIEEVNQTAVQSPSYMR